MDETIQHHPWLTALKRIASDTPESSRTDVLECVTARTDKTDNTHPADSFVGCVSASNQAHEAEVAWRVAAFRERIPQRDPIWPPRLRDTPLCDTPGYCSLCGDELPTDPAHMPRFPRCHPCIRALRLAMYEKREAQEH